jgi:hypothetical protein
MAFEARGGMSGHKRKLAFLGPGAMPEADDQPALELAVMVDMVTVPERCVVAVVDTHTAFCLAADLIPLQDVTVGTAGVFVAKHDRSRFGVPRMLRDVFCKRPSPALSISGVH